jgi:endonuclease/exonuclease/phosphatase family metal-dependent hydrolase
VIGSVGAVRVATFNLLHGWSLEHGADTGALRAAASTLDADVVVLQEVDRDQERSGHVDQTSVVAAELGAAWWRFVPSLSGTPGSAWSPIGDEDVSGPAYGLGVVSRLPVRSVQVRRFRPAPVGLPLHVAGRRGLTPVRDEPRVVVAALMSGPAGSFTVLGTHLSFVPGWNVRQLRAVVRWARTLPAPRLLLGDLNLPAPVVRRVTGWTPLARVATYPSWRPRVQLDHVLADRPLPVSAAQALRLEVSDHLAVVADVSLDGYW